MNKLRFAFTALAFMAFTLAVSSGAQAQATRTWVSGVGDDVNPCSRTAPCKTYAGAISKTARHGEISTLDPGGFGTLTITKSITVNGGGGGQGYGSVLAALTTGFIINITDAADTTKTVRLNHLDINGASTGTDGIRWVAGVELHVENTFIDGFTGEGIDVENTTATNRFMSLRNVTIRNCANGIQTSGTIANATNTVIAENINVTRCGIGFDAQNGTRANVFRSVIGMNTTGFNLSDSNSGTVVHIDSTGISGNSGLGINITGGARARIARCLISGNLGGSLAPAASVDSGGNNNIVGNVPNTAPAGTPFAQN
jgi:hypothetical protein